MSNGKSSIPPTTDKESTGNPPPVRLVRNKRHGPRWPKRNTKSYWDTREEIRSRLAREIEASMAERMARRKQTPERKTGKDEATD